MYTASSTQQHTAVAEEAEASLHEVARRDDPALARLPAVTRPVTASANT